MYKELLEIVKNLRCDECCGSGATSTPRDYGPCSNCDGTGFIIEASYNDIFSDLKKYEQKEN